MLGSIKLVGGRDDHEGNIEVLHNGKWGIVCDDEWDKNEAEVVCRQLGYNLGGKVTHSSTFGKGNRRFWMDNLFCTGKENKLSECRFDGWGVSDCEDTEVAGVICNAELPEEKNNKVVVKNTKFKIKKQDVLKIRLVGGRIPEEGRVEVQYNSNEWGDICSDGWGLLEVLIHFIIIPSYY